MVKGKMRPWVFMAEMWFDQLDAKGVNYFLDGWQDAGYDTVMFGRLDLKDGDTIYPSFSPDRLLYRNTLLKPPELPSHLGLASERLRQAMAAVKERGFGVCLFSPDPYLATGPHKVLSDFTAADCVNYYHARLQDAYQNYPMANRILLDGPEWSYEPQVFRWRDRTIFNEFDNRPAVREKATELGYDFDRIVWSVKRIEEKLGHLTEEKVRRFLAGQKGSLDGMDLLLLDPGLWDWFRFKHETMKQFMDGLRRLAKTLNPSLQIGLGPRLPTWARITGCSLKSISQVTDFQAPKIYLWKGGFDGYYGTLQRCADYLLTANPELPEEACLSLLFRILGIEMPDIRTVADLQKPFPSSYFEVTLANELRKIRADVADLDAIVPYVQTGPNPHAGEPMVSSELEQIIETMQDEGFTRFIHYWHGVFDDEVKVVKSFT